MSDQARILIAGGGIAGLTLASALRRRGLAVELVERSTRWEPVGGGIAVQPNAMRVLDRIGIGCGVRQAGAVIRRWLFRDQHGTVLCDIPLAPLWGDVGPFIGIARTALQAALKAGASEVRLGVWATSLRQEDGRVAVSFSDGGAGAYDLVVGADGIHSATREFVSGSAPPVYGGQMVWRSLAPVELADRDSVQFWLGDGCFFGLCPVQDGTYGFGNVTAPRFHEPVEGRLARLRDRFSGFGAPIRDFLAAVPDDAQIHCGPIEWIEVDPWHRGRVVLIGDAAHASSPMMGQGGSMAMEDALVLAESLDAAPGVEAAIDMFIARRRPRVELVQQQSRAVGEMLRLPPERRNAALRENGQTALYHRFQPLVAPP